MHLDEATIKKMIGHSLGENIYYAFLWYPDYIKETLNN